MKLEKFTGSLENVDEAICKKLEELNFVKLSEFEPNSSEIPEISSKLVLILSPSNHIVENFTNKVIFIPPVDHEVFLSDLKDSVVACSAQQIRMRRCENLMLYNFVKGSVFSEQKCSKIRLFPYQFHAKSDERREKQIDRRHFATFQSLDNPFNPGACFTVIQESESSFFKETERISQTTS